MFVICGPSTHVQLYAACWLTSGVAVIGGTQTHLAMVVDIKANKVGIESDGV